MVTQEQAFIQVVEAGSFKKAAEHLGVETSSLSRKVAALEQRLAVKLLHRSTSRTRPTELGRAFYAGLRRIVDDKAALEEEISGGLDLLAGRLRIGATVDFGDRFVAPVLAGFLARAPSLSIELLLDSDLDNLGEKDLDVAFRLGPMPDSSLIARPVGEIQRVLVASPEYLSRCGHPVEPSQLAGHQFVLYSAAQVKHDIVFGDGQRVAAAGIRRQIAANSLRAIREMVLAGVGVNWGPAWFFADDIASGQLVELMTEHPVEGLKVSAVYPERAWLPGKTREIIRLVGEQIAAESVHEC